MRQLQPNMKKNTPSKRHNRAAIVAGALIFTALFSAPSTFAQSPTVVPAAAPLLADGGFEAAPGGSNPWRPFQHAGVKAYEFARDKEVKTEGTQSLRVTQREEQVFGAVRQSIARPPVGRYELSAQMRSRGTDGKGWRLEVALLLENGEVLTYDAPQLTGDVEWTRRELRFDIPATTLFLEVIVGLHGNRGTGWLDAMVLKPLP